jgi:adenylosuccinate lyase
MTDMLELSQTGAESLGMCAHNRGHITDSRFFGDRYATPASRKIFCDDCRKQRWLDIEAALAQAQAELGMIPEKAARQIAATARVEVLDLDAVRAEINASGHSLVGLLRVLQSSCPEDSGQYIHFGATTQDIQDTGQVLEMRDVLDEVERYLRRLVARTADIAEEHAGTVALGRTHAQPALPMSFGLKVANWLDELLRHSERLETVRPRVIAAQLFGGAGTMAGFGGRGRELIEGFARRLGLATPDIGWHVARDRVVEFVSTMAMITGTLARIADEIRTLSRPEFGEVAEPWRHGKVGSSTMPHKRNPERCEQVVAMAKLSSIQVSAALAGMVGDHERDSRALRVEWACVPDVSHYTLCACEIISEILDGLIVFPDRLRRNVQVAADQIASERLMLALGESVGKQNAHEHVYELCQQAYEQRRPMRELLGERPDLVAHLDPALLDEIFEPARYLGESRAITERGVAKARRWLGRVSA